MNKRYLKQDFNYICDLLLIECVNAPKVDDNEKDALLADIMALRQDYLSRVSHPEPGLSQKAYFKAIVTEFQEKVEEMFQRIYHLNS